MGTLDLVGDLNLSFDVNLADAEMDSISFGGLASKSGKLNIIELNFISQSEKDETNVIFSENSNLFEVTQYTGPSSYVLGDFSYSVKYEDGVFTFVRTLVQKSSVNENVVKGVFSGINNALVSSNNAVKSSLNGRISQLNSVHVKSSTNNKKGQSGGDEDAKFGLWAQALYGRVDRERTSSSVGFKGHSEGVVIGSDAEIIDNVIAGVAYAYTKSNMKSKGVKSDIDTHGFYAYGQYMMDDKFINGSLGYGFSKTDPKDGDKDIKSSFYSLDTLAGYKMRSKVGNFTPAMGLRYVRIEQKSYHEDDVKVKSKNANTLTAVVQVGWNGYYKFADKKIKSKASVGFVYDLKSDNNKVIISSAGTKTLAEDGRLKRFGTELSLGAETRVTNNWNVSLDYTGEFRQYYENHTGTLSVRYDF